MAKNGTRRRDASASATSGFPHIGVFSSVSYGIPLDPDFPLLDRNRWLYVSALPSLSQGCPGSRLPIGASLAVTVIETFYPHAWDSPVLAVVPVYFAVRLYAALLNHRHSESRHRDAVESLDQPLSVVDSSGRVTLWNDALARLVGCSREQAMGHPLAHVLRTLAANDLPRAVDDALKNRRSHTLNISS